jgi:hypothetical protein
MPKITRKPAATVVDTAKPTRVTRVTTVENMDEEVSALLSAYDVIRIAENKVKSDATAPAELAMTLLNARRAVRLYREQRALDMTALMLLGRVTITFMGTAPAVEIIAQLAEHWRRRYSTPSTMHLLDGL